MIQPPDYEQEVREKRIANIYDLWGNPNSPDVAEKIKKFASRTGLDEHFVRYNLLTNELFAMHFAKDPSRQSKHQTIAARHIREAIPLTEGFKVLPASGDNALYVINGQIQPGKEVHANTRNHGKSIDFSWSLTFAGKTLEVYAAHKHTSEEGGAQQNQYQDLQQFLSQAQSCVNPQKLFLALCDGPFYQRALDTHGQSTRIELMNRDYHGERVRACSLAELPQVYAEFIRAWLDHNKLSMSPELENILLRLET